MKSIPHCPECGKTADGICHSCLVSGLFSEESEYFDLPRQLGEFHLDRRIGKGASGEVWKAFQPGPDRDVALKIFLDPRLGGSADRSRFKAEAQALGKLEDPAIVPVFATGEDRGFLFIASRWMPGGTLADHDSAPSTPTGWRKIAQLVTIISRAVAEAHRHGLVHRDIKPANILLDEGGDPYLADFGIVEAEGLNEERFASGTPAYMAPEQAESEAVTTLVDIYGLGALLFDLLTGSPPPREGEQREIAMQSIDPDLGAICLKCLKEDPKERYSSASGISDDLQAWLNGEPVTARKISPANRLQKWARRHPAMAGLSGLAVLSSVIIAGTIIVGSDALRRERNEAVKQEKIAQFQKQTAQETADRFREHSYAADLYLANRALLDGQIGIAREMLDRHKNEASEKDIRGFEWHAYHASCKGEEKEIFRNHTGAVSTVAFSPDNRYLASGGWDRRVYIRDLESKELILTLPRANAPKKGVAEIPRLTRVLADSPELKMQVLLGKLNIDEFRMRSRPSDVGELAAMSWTPDGKRFVTASGGSFVRIWSFPSGTLLACLPLQHTRKIQFTQDGRHLVALQVIKDQRDISVYDAENLTLLKKISGTGETFAIHGNELVCQTLPDLRIRRFDLSSRKQIMEWPMSHRLHALTYSANGKQVIGLDGRSEFRWSRSGDPMDAPELELRGVTRSLVSAPGLLAMAGTGQMIGLRTGTGLREFKPLRGHEDEITDLATSPDGNLLASASKDQTVRIWEIARSQKDDISNSRGGASIKAHSTDGSLWLSETNDQRALVGSIDQAPVLLSPDHPCKPLLFSEEGSQAATWRKNGKNILIEWWSTTSGEKTKEVKLDLKVGPASVVAARDGVVAVTSIKAGIDLFDLNSGELIEHFPSSKGDIVRMVISPDLQQVAAVYWPRTVRIAHLEKGWLGPWKLTKGSVGPVIFSPDSKWLVSGNNENRIVVHDAQTGQEIRQLTGHRESPLALAFTPDGRTLVSSSRDRTCRFWHIPTWRDLGAFENGSFSYYLGFDHKGNNLLIGRLHQPPKLFPGK